MPIPNGTLTLKEMNMLLHAGFLKREIRQIDQAKTVDKVKYQNIDLNNEKWQAVIKSRRIFVNRRKGHGADIYRIRAGIVRLYRLNNFTTPFDFIKELYVGERQPKRLQNFDFALKKTRKKKGYAQKMNLED